MPYLFIAADPREVDQICCSTEQAHCVMNHKFPNKEIPFKLDAGSAILAAMCCPSQLALQVMQHDTQWMVIAVWLTALDIECLFMGRMIYWTRYGINVTTCLMRQPDEVVGAFVLAVWLFLQHLLEAKMSCLTCNMW